MTNIEFNKLLNQYSDYCKNDGRKYTHLPFVVWLKQVAKRG